LVNNAGVIEPIGALVQSDPAAWARNISVNVVSAYNTARATVPHMHGRVAARLYGIANALDGMSRAEAARLAGMERQALRDAVLHYNSEDLAGSM
jgi:NAD(P)-dependent dehydrogenase (short-subunit alcohol dehydrogenase family)